MLFQFVVCFLLIAIAVVNGWNQFGFRSNNKMMRTKNTILRVSTDTVVESAPSSGATPEGGSSKKSKDKDYSIYTPGQQIEGTLLSAKQFGIFVKLEQGIDALIPRSTLSRSGYDKLKGMVDAKSKEAVKIELISVNIENKTISAKYLPLVAEESFDLSTLDPKVLKTKLFDATILSAHDFGVFAKVDGVDIDGLVPASLLPDRSGGSIQSLYP